MKLLFQPVGGKVGKVGNAGPVPDGRVGNVGNVAGNVAPGGRVMYGNGVGI